MNFYIAEPVTRLPLFNFLVRYIFTEVLKESHLQNERLSRDDACRVFPGRNDLVSV